MDINVDYGEGILNESLLLDYVTSANVACGGHYGDKTTMTQAVLSCQSKQIAIGAHPSYPDKIGFGRRKLDMPIENLIESVTTQIEALNAILVANQIPLHHIKLHGALYNEVARNTDLCKALMRVLKAYYPDVIYFTLANSPSVEIIHELGLKVFEEAFADRNYLPDGSLVPRTEANALIQDEETLCQHLTSLEQTLGKTPDTICIHSDTENALAIATKVHAFWRHHDQTLK